MLACAGAAAALDDDEFLDKTITLVHTELAFLQNRLAGMGADLFSHPVQFFSD
ncbi:MAG: hypothetical protein R2860_12040 [Desulfobacterales bacterium]